MPRATANEGHGCSLTENEAENVAALRAERHADTDFARALADQIRDDAVDADAGERERDQRRKRRAGSWKRRRAAKAFSMTPCMVSTA